MGFGVAQESTQNVFLEGIDSMTIRVISESKLVELGNLSILFSNMLMTRILQHRSIPINCLEIEM